MLTRHFDFDAFTGMEMLFHYDEDKDTTTLEYRQDVESQLDSCKQLHNERFRQGGRLQDYEHYAHIPNGVAMKWKLEKGIDVFNKDHQKAVFRLLNDPEYAHLKIATFFHQPK